MHQKENNQTNFLKKKNLMSYCVTIVCWKQKFRFVDLSCLEMLPYYLSVRIFTSVDIIINVCKYDNALCTDKSANAGFMYVQTGKSKEQINIKGHWNEQTNE